jgi:hypothetical protein
MALRSVASYRRPKVSEISLHMSAAAFLRRAWPEELPWTHFPAGELRDKATGGKLKAMGLAPGWADFLFVMPNAQLAMLELKVPGGVLSDAQIEVKQKCQRLGCAYAVARSMEELEDIVVAWLAAYGLKPRARLARRAA